MFFSDVIGQNTIKKSLIQEINNNRMAHAQLFCGKEGVGKMALALAYARYLLCTNKGEKDACGVCPSCVKFSKLIHPDLHFIFPVFKKKNKETLSNDCLKEWREMLLNSTYFNNATWLKEIGAENQQLRIYTKESDLIAQKLSYVSSQGGYKIAIIWLPERMMTECANKLLKLLEEPPQKTIFLLVTENPGLLLPTIISRTQRIEIPTIEELDVITELINRFALPQKEAMYIAHNANGNFIKAIEAVQVSEETLYYFDLFVELMRMSYLRKLKEMHEWSFKVAAIGRERQKTFLEYAQQMIRENFIYNFHQEEMNYLTVREKEFSTRFSPFINEKNVIDIMTELSEAQQHIEQNVNPKMVFFDFAMKMIMLLKR